MMPYIFYFPCTAPVFKQQQRKNFLKITNHAVFSSLILKHFQILMMIVYANVASSISEQHFQIGHGCAMISLYYTLTSAWLDHFQF
jgi:hypothetical protein